MKRNIHDNVPNNQHQLKAINYSCICKCKYIVEKINDKTWLKLFY